MPTPDNVTVARTFHEAWAERNPDKGAAVIADDCIFVDVPRNEIQRGLSRMPTAQRQPTLIQNSLRTQKRELNPNRPGQRLVHHTASLQSATVFL